MSRLGAVLLTVLLAACRADAGVVEHKAPIRIEAAAIPLQPDKPDVVKAGAFTFAGGLWLKAPSSDAFGGFSDLKVDAKGDIVSESDEGALLKAHLVLDSKGRLVGLDKTTLEPLRGEDGQPLRGKRLADAEGVVKWPNGDLMVSFERDHRIWVYPAAGGPPKVAPMPDVSMPDNAGMEGLAPAPSQGPDAYWVGIEGGSIWLCRLKGGCSPWTGLMAPPLSYRLSALAETPSGELVLLHHSWNPFNSESRILATILSLPKNRRDVGHIKAQLQLAPPQTVDNFEGVAAVPSPGGGLRLYLISDDNFSDKQRTLLFAFDLDHGPRRPSH